MNEGNEALECLNYAERAFLAERARWCEREGFATYVLPRYMLKGLLATIESLAFALERAGDFTNESETRANIREDLRTIMKANCDC